MNFQFGRKYYPIIVIGNLSIHLQQLNESIDLTGAPIQAPMVKYLPIFTNCEIHLNTRNGTYRVISYTKHNAKISCQAWINRKQWGQSDYDYMIVPRSDIKCFHGRPQRKRPLKI